MDLILAQIALAKYQTYKRECREKREEKAKEALRQQVKKDAATKAIGMGFKGIKGLRKVIIDPKEEAREKAKERQKDKEMK